MYQGPVPIIEPKLDHAPPSFAEYRIRNDATMVPDKGFTKQLKKLDKNFEVVWDFGASKWEIWRFDPDQPGVHITTVQTKNRTYRELGADILIQLQQSDPTRFSIKEIEAYLDETENQNRRRKARDFKNKIESITKETFDFVRGVPKISVPRNYNIQEAVRIG